MLGQVDGKKIALFEGVVKYVLFQDYGDYFWENCFLVEIYLEVQGR